MLKCLIVKQQLKWLPPSLATGRKRKASAWVNDSDKKDEEEWCLKDVIFVEDVKTVPLGKVLKVCRLIGAMEMAIDKRLRSLWK